MPNTGKDIMSSVNHIGGMGAWLSYHSTHHGNRRALSDGARELTYSQLNDRVNRLANLFLARGLRPGDRVALMLLNGAEFIEAVFACAKIGAIAVPLNYRLGPAEIHYIASDASPAIAVYHDLFASLIAPWLAEASDCYGLPVASSGSPVDGDTSYEDALARSDGAEPGVEVGQSDPVLMMYTSGTTGRPKGALLTHSNMTWNALNLFLSEMAVSADEVVLTVAPMFHIGGLNIHTLPTLYKGGRVVLLSRFDPQEVIEVIARERVTSLFLVPQMWLALMQHPAIGTADLSSLRIAVSGGAPCPLPVLQYFQSRGVVFLEGFGMTETAPNACVLPAADAARKNGSVGRPLAHMQMRIVDNADIDVPLGAVGELVVRGPNVFREYWNSPEATSEAFRNGWFHTGDLARQDDEGFFYIVDRKKDMLISGGENVFPAEIERVILLHPAVADVAVIGVPDPRWGEVPAAAVVLKNGSTTDLAELRDFACSSLARFKLPQHLVLVTDLPRNSVGKVLKRDLRDQFVATAQWTEQGVK